MENDILFPIIFKNAADSLLTISTVNLGSVSTDQTIALSWVGRIVEINNTTDINMTLTGFANDDIFTLWKTSVNAHEITFVAGSGTVIHSLGGRVKQIDQYSHVTVHFYNGVYKLIGRVWA